MFDYGIVLLVGIIALVGGGWGGDSQSAPWLITDGLQRIDGLSEGGFGESAGQLGQHGATAMDGIAAQQFFIPLPRLGQLGDGLGDDGLHTLQVPIGDFIAEVRQRACIRVAHSSFMRWVEPVLREGVLSIQAGHDVAPFHGSGCSHWRFYRKA